MGWEIPAGVMASVRSPGPFAFWGGVNLVSPAFVTVANFSTAATAEEFALQRFKGSIGLSGFDHR